MIRSRVHVHVVLFCCWLALSVGLVTSATAVPVKDPSAIQLLAMLSLGEDGTAWVETGHQKILVTPGYQLARGLRVVSVRRDSVVLYDIVNRRYFTLDIPGTDVIGLQRHHEATIRSRVMPLPMLLRMVALAWRHDYICQSLTAAVAQPVFHARDEKYLLERLMPPQHSFRLRNNLLWCSPAVVMGKPWTTLLGRIDEYRSERLAEWYPALAKRGTIIADGKDLFAVIKTIEHQTKVPMRWEAPHSYPLYCSLRDRPWHEILETILLFNGLGLYPTEHGLMIAPAR